MQSKEIISFLKRPDANDWILSYFDSTSDEIILRAKALHTEEKRALATLVKLYKKGKEKLPEYVRMRAAMNDKCYEQSSSELLAHYKASLFNGKLLLNLSGGLGVDDYAFSKTFDQVISLDSDADIHAFAAYNFHKMGIDNVTRLHQSSETYELPCADLIYIDPDRRIANERNYRLNNASPDVVGLQHIFLEKSPEVLIKLSPMADITEILKVFPTCSEIRVVSLMNEVKEILVKLERNPKSTEIYAVVVTEHRLFEFSEKSEQKAIMLEIEKDEIFFVEPAASLIKANLDEVIFQKLGFVRVGLNAAFYIGKLNEDNLPGRAFKLVAEMDFGSSSFQTYLKKHNIKKANIKKRDFPLDTEAIKRKFKLQDGGDDYLFFYKDFKGNLKFAHGIKPAIKHSLF